MVYKNEVQNPVQSPTLNPDYITSQMNFIFRARLLWRDLATWLRAYMISLYGGVGNTQAISQRLYKLPLEYGNILRVFFGDQATEQLINLITQYIAIFQSLFTAQINNDINAVNYYTQLLYKNVDDRAAFFAGINPYWIESEWSSLLTSYTSMQIAEATALSGKEFERDIDIFDRVLALTTIIGDYFSEGIINYFLLQQRQPSQPPQQPQVS